MSRLDWWDVSITVLGIETSCDETGVAVVRDGELLADVTATSMDEYARYGGIIPEIASRSPCWDRRSTCGPPG